MRRLRGLTPDPIAGWVPEPPFAVADELVQHTRRAARIAPTVRALGGLALLVVLAVASAMVAWWLSRPHEQPLPPRVRTIGAPLQAGAAATGQADASAPLPQAGSGRLFVHVVGAVRHPGVVELPPGSRVTDAVAAAGGVTRAAAPASVNLARPVLDGEQVVVLRRGDPAGAPSEGSDGGQRGGSAVAAPGPTGPVDLNAASLDQLDGLPGIGPVLAQRILDWRTAHGRFSSVDELGEVSGIGEATLADLRPAVRV